jgi:uncharacterized RDD family membrane protein YckC
MNERDFSVGLVVVGFRAGKAAGRVVVYPLRLIAGGRVARDGAQARAFALRQAESATTAVLAAPELERVLDRALEAPVPEAVVRKLVDHVLASPEIDRVIEHVAASPAVREAVKQQSTGFADEVAARMRLDTARADDGAERRVRALLRRPVREPGGAYGGLATRTVAFLLDLMLLAVAFVVVGALAGLVVSLVGDVSAATLAGLLGVSWTLAALAYFTFFWSTTGQTPGLRVLGQHVVRVDGGRIGPGRAALRFLILTFGFVVLLGGVLLILVDDRRRGLHDVLTGTVVTP